MPQHINNTVRTSPSSEYSNVDPIPQRQRIIVVTGATGGIGRSTVQALLDEHHQSLQSGHSQSFVLILQGYRRIQELNDWAETIQDPKFRIVTVSANLANPDERREFLDQVMRICQTENSTATHDMNGNLPTKSRANIKTKRTKRKITTNAKVQPPKITRSDNTSELLATDSPTPHFGLTVPDALVCAAGIDLMSQVNHSLVFEQRLQRAIDLDLMATIDLSRALGAQMRSNGRGVIVTLGWDGVSRGMPGETAQIYSIVKGAIVAFSRSLAQELAPEVRVCSVSPGWIATSWGTQASAVMRRRGANESLTRRWGQPDEVGSLIRFLLSNDAAFINATDIPINGGYRIPRNNEY